MQMQGRRGAPEPKLLWFGPAPSAIGRNGAVQIPQPAVNPLLPQYRKEPAVGQLQQSRFIEARAVRLGRGTPCQWNSVLIISNRDMISPSDTPIPRAQDAAAPGLLTAALAPDRAQHFPVLQFDDAAVGKCFLDVDFDWNGLRPCLTMIHGAEDDEVNFMLIPLPGDSRIATRIENSAVPQSAQTHR